MNGSRNNRDKIEPRQEPYTAFDLAQIHGASAVNIIAGVWLLMAPLYLGYPRPISRWNDMFVGLVLIVLASWRYLRPLHRFWISWINACLGLWLIAAPFVLECDLIAAQVNDITVGIIVFLAGAISGSVRSFNC